MTKRSSQFPNLEQEYQKSEALHYVGSLLCEGRVMRTLGHSSSQQISSFSGGSFGFNEGYARTAQMFGAYFGVSNLFGVGAFRPDIIPNRARREQDAESEEGPVEQSMPRFQSARPAPAPYEGPLFRAGEELVRKNADYDINLYKMANEQVAYISLHEMMLQQMFSETKNVGDLQLRYFSEKDFLQTNTTAFWTPVRIEIYVRESIFNQDYKRRLQRNEQRITELKEKAKQLRKQMKETKAGQSSSKLELREFETEAEELQAENNLHIAHRQLIIKLIRMVGARIEESALIKPEFSKDMTTRLVLLKERCEEEIKWNKNKKVKFEEQFDNYCLYKCGKMPVLKYLKNAKELRQHRRNSAKPRSFKRVLCSPEVLRLLTEEEQIENAQFQSLLANKGQECARLLSDLVVDILSNEQQEYDISALKENPELAQELREEILEEEKKLDKSIEVKKGRTLSFSEGLTTRLFLSGRFKSPEQSHLLEKRLMNKIMSRKKNKELFDEYELEAMHIRQYPTPNKIATRLLQHQAQALTWMKYREQNISQDFVLRDDYKGKLIPKERPLSAYWEEARLIDGKRVFINYFTGEFSNKPTHGKVVRGGILAYDMGLGKTITALSLIYDINGSKFVPPKKGVLCGRNLYVTIPTVLPNEIEELVRKHVRPPLNYVIVNATNRKQLRDLTSYDIVFISYETLKSEFKDFEESGGYRTKDIDSSSEFSDNVELIKVEPGLTSDFPSKQLHEQRPLHNGRTTIFGYYWHRIILDEAHHIRNRDTITSEATCALQGWYRWCLTGTPVQNNKTEIYALLKFLRIEIFCEWKWWNRYIEKSQNLQDGFATLHKILRKIMLTKSKTSKNLEGEAIISLPKKHEQVVLVKLSEEERCAYELMRQMTENFIKKLIENRNKRDKTEEEKKQNRKDNCDVFILLMRLRQFCDDPCLALPNFSSRKTQQEIKSHLEKNMRAQQEDGDPNELLEEYLCARCKFEDEGLRPLRCGHQICRACQEDVGGQQEMECPICSRPAVVVRPFRANRDESDMSTIAPFSVAPRLMDRAVPPRAAVRAPDAIPEVEDEEADEPQQEYYSSKLLKIISLALEIVERGEKVIIFSQWIKMMERIAKELDWYSIRVVCLNSRLKIPERRELLEQFIRFDISVLVTSLKTSGEGLNLTAASNVIIVDPDWNPTIEQQGIDRAHRFGQEREVTIYRMIVEKSIETKLRELHEKKIDERNYTMMDRKFFQNKKYIERMLSLVSRDP